jgi:hypothetical protein
VADKLALREFELAFIKTQMDLKNLADKAMAIKTNYEKTLDMFIKKYGINALEYAWDEASASFVSIEKKLADDLRKL